MSRTRSLPPSNTANVPAQFPHTCFAIFGTQQNSPHMSRTRCCHLLNTGNIPTHFPHTVFPSVEHYPPNDLANPARCVFARCMTRGDRRKHVAPRSIKTSTLTQIVAQSRLQKRRPIFGLCMRCTSLPASSEYGDVLGPQGFLPRCCGHFSPQARHCGNAQRGHAKTAADLSDLTCAEALRMILHVRQNSREHRHVALIPHTRAAPHLDDAQQTAGQATHSQN